MFSSPSSLSHPAPAGRRVGASLASNRASLFAVGGRRLSLLGLATAILILLASLFTPGSPISLTSPAQPSSGPELRGTIAAIRQQGSSAHLTVRRDARHLQPVTITAADRLLAANGRPVLPSNLRVGDLLIVTGNHTARDLSQTWREIAGIVASPPDLDLGGDTMVVQVGGSGSIMVDLDTDTRITSAPPANQPTTILDGDEVQLNGLFDQPLGEMTQTVAIVRQGPNPRPLG